MGAAESEGVWGKGRFDLAWVALVTQRVDDVVGVGFGAWAGSVATLGLPRPLPELSALPPVSLGRAILLADASVLGANPAGSLLLGTTFTGPPTESPRLPAKTTELRF